MKGHGSGSASWMNEALVRHRENEESFRFKSADELRLVEIERRKLEKELRELDEVECFFYDFSGLQATYDFDRRHRKIIQNVGAFRQDLRWTEDEIVAYEFSAIANEKRRLDKEGEVLCDYSV